ncbi:HNH endonuclease [Granulosicoccus sp.]|nr:HNH endonuclease signature motif containing protein [Granulosicoccus sp.]MDB4223442.1 HNH endonuclease [Granulosicoccus sp.]
MEANPDFSSVSTPDLENSITRLCADLNAATYRQLVMMVGYHEPINESDERTITTDDQRRDAENQGAMHHHQCRQLSTQWDEHGCLQIRARLTPEQGALVIKAIEAAVESIKESEPSVDSDSHALEDTNDTPAGAFSIKENQQYPKRRADALILMAEAYLKDTKVASNTDDRYQVVVHVDSEVLSQNVFEKTSGEPDCYIEKQVALPVETARRLSCSCKVVTALTKQGEPLNIGRSSRAIPTGIRRALTIRDGSCQFPGCDCQQHLDAHHIVHWANGGETSLDNLVELCHHHHRLMHEGQFSLIRQAEGRLVFRRPDGDVIRQTVQPEKHEAVRVPPLTHKRPWSGSGEAMDYSTALYCIEHANRKASSSVL